MATETHYIEIERELQTLIYLMDCMRDEREVIVVGAEEENFVELLRRLHKAREMIGKQKMEEWREAVVKVRDIFHYLNIKNI